MNEGGTPLFSQRAGYEPLPAPLQLEELPDAARRAIWNALYAYVVGPQVRDSPPVVALRDLFVYHDNMPLDEWPTWIDTNEIVPWMRDRLEREPFNRVFDRLEFLMRHKFCPTGLILELSDAFHRFQLAYIIIDSGPSPKIFPATTAAEGNELRRNLAELAGLDGCATHLRNASKCINDSDAAGSVRESIHAVESVARQIDPEASETPGPALASLEKRSTLHPTLKVAFNNLYGYTNREQGIRHALLDNVQANVTIDEAVFMLGACASFASYLWRKPKAATAP